MTSLVVYRHELVVTEKVISVEEDREADLNLLTRKLELIAELAKLSKLHDEFLAKLRSMELTFTQMYPDVMSEYIAAKAELADLAAMEREAQVEFGQGSSETDLDEGEDKDTPKDKTKESVKDTKVADKDKQATKAAVKHMFRKISSKCHPDKTKNPRLHELFQKAKAYKDENFLEGLNAVWGEIQGTPSNFVSAVKAAIRDLESSVAHKTQELFQLKSSVLAKYYTSFYKEETRKEACEHFKQQMKFTVEQLKAELIRRKSSKPAPQ